MKQHILRTVNTLHRISRLQAFSALISVGGVIFAASALFSRRYALFATLLISSAVLTLLLLLWQWALKQSLSDTEPYHIPITVSTAEEIAAAFQAEPLGDNTYYTFLQYPRAISRPNTIRLLLLSSLQSTASELAQQRRRANRIINQRHDYANEGPREEVCANVRLNLHVFSTETDCPASWLKQDATKLLGRTENIVQAAIITDTSTLILQPLAGQDIPLPYALRNYRLVLSILLDKLGKKQ